jgi:hypothetical protein
MPNHSDTIGQRMARHLRSKADQLAPPTTDLDRVRAYANPPRPVEFAKEVLGLNLWSKQREIVGAVAHHKRIAVRSGNKAGKLLHGDTPIPTPEGWRKFSDLNVGDQVFDDRGQPCTIIAEKHWRNRKMMRVHFEDGTWIDADERHEWVIHTYRSRRNHLPPTLLETRDIAANLYQKMGSRAILNCSIDLPAAIELPHQHLTLDPYLLGVWLGDGTSARGELTSADGLERPFDAAGFESTFKGKYRYHLKGLRAELCWEGLINNKHVPDKYLWASKEQRLALLQGLMDTDGCVSTRGMCEFTNTKKVLADAVLFLARSLGIKARIAEGRAQVHGKDCGPKWRVTWCSPLPVFRIPRKLARIRTTWGRKKNAHKRMMITSIESLSDRVKSKCIEVDSPSHLFLAGPSMIPTHNSEALAALAIWFYCSFPRARVIITATTNRQVNDIIWGAIKRLVRSAKISIPGAEGIHQRADAGLVNPSDWSEIKGYTARAEEAIAGISGPYILYLIDEASGVEDRIFQAIDGNRAGGNAWVFLISNPTKSEGTFFDAFHSKSKAVIGDGGYFGIQIDTRQSPNCTGEWRELGDQPIPGLAMPDWIAEKLAEYGPDDPFFKARVTGEFVTIEQAKIFSLAMITHANQKWEDTPTPKGRLFIGCDPAGDGDGGDQSGFAARIANKHLEFRAKAGLTAEEHILELEGLIHRHHQGGLIPVVMIESEGSVGWDVYRVIRDYADAHKTFEVRRVQTSHKSRRDSKNYAYVRDELWGCARAWTKDGGVFPPNANLERDLHAPEFKSDVQGRLRVTPKKELRKILGRSPDLGDAFCLSVWEPNDLRMGSDTAPELNQPPQVDSGEIHFPEQTLDPFDWQSSFRR